MSKKNTVLWLDNMHTSMIFDWFRGEAIWGFAYEIHYSIAVYIYLYTKFEEKHMHAHNAGLVISYKNDLRSSSFLKALSAIGGLHDGVIWLPLPECFEHFLIQIYISSWKCPLSIY
jgi:hypothetical protein